MSASNQPDTDPSDNLQSFLPSFNSEEGVPNIEVVISVRPKFTVVFAEGIRKLHFCKNALAVIELMKEHDRDITIGDVYKSLDMPPRYKYRLRERLNGAVIQRVPRNLVM